MTNQISLKSVNVKKHDDYDDYLTAVNRGDYNIGAVPEGIQYGPFEAVKWLGGRKQMFTRRTALMDPQNAARYAYKNDYKLNLGQDWDGDGVNDIVITNGNDIRAFNGYTIAENDWKGKQAYFNQHKKARKQQSYRDFMRKAVYDAELNPDQSDGYMHRSGPEYVNPAYAGFAKPRLSKVSAFDIFKFEFKTEYDKFYSTQHEDKLHAHANFIEICRKAYNIIIVNLISKQLGSNLKTYAADVVKVLTAIKNKKVIKDALWNAVQFVRQHARQYFVMIVPAMLGDIHGVQVFEDGTNAEVIETKFKELSAEYNKFPENLTLSDAEISRFMAEKQ